MPPRKIVIKTSAPERLNLRTRRLSVVVTRLGRVVGTWEGTKRVREVEESVLDVVLAFFSVVIVGRGVVVSGKGTKRVVGNGEGIKRVIIAVLDAASVVLDVVAAALVKG